MPSPRTKPKGGFGLEGDREMIEVERCKVEVEGWENSRGEAGGDGRLGMGQTVNDRLYLKG